MAALKAPILLTGFDAFEGVPANPSRRVAQALAGQSVQGSRVHALVLPTVFELSRRQLEATLAALRPRLVLALGAAPARAAIGVERVAINVDDARIADNAGRQPIDCPIVAGGPAAYFARLPIKAIVAALREAGFAAEVSHSAGTFVCNHVFYALMHALRRRRTVRAGFVHLPVPADAAAARQEEAVRIALEVALGVAQDLPAAGGSVD